MNSVGPAVLGDPVDAAQFEIVNGQLEQMVPDGTILYANVQPPANSSVVKLGVSWETTPDTLGTFMWGGDSVEWSSTTVSRPQNNVNEIISSVPSVSTHLHLSRRGLSVQMLLATSWSSSTLGPMIMIRRRAARTRPLTPTRVPTRQTD